jgi:AcrR family transcriptional regulator
MSTSAEIPRRLPRGTHGLDRDVVEASQRTRLLEAIGRAVAEKGYAGATIDDVVRRAGVSKKTFYDHFADKEDCFLAAYQAASGELLRRVREAHEGHEDWEERTRAGIATYAGSRPTRPSRACS